MEEQIVYVGIERLKPGMKLAEDVYTEKDNLLLDAGTVLTDEYIAKISIWDIQQVSIYKETLKKPEFEKPIIKISPEEEKDKGRKQHQYALKNVSQIMTKILQKNVLDVDSTKEVVDTIITETFANRNLLISLTNIKSFDNYLYAHSVNVCALSIVTGIGLGYNNKQLKELGTGALLHDIGMLKIDRKILNKVQPLTDTEWDEIKKHPNIGFEMISDFDGLSINSKNVVLQHHEREDGSGYPKALKGSIISEYAGIVAVCDVYEALTSPRIYRDKHISYKAMKMLISSSTHLFSQKVIKIFISLMALYPVGSFVKLNNDTVGIVIEANQNFPIRPRLKIILDESNKRYETPKIVNLLEEPGLYIKAAVDSKSYGLDSIEEF